jgi:hypothetical protein
VAASEDILCKTCGAKGYIVPTCQRCGEQHPVVEPAKKEIESGLNSLLDWTLVPMELAPKVISICACGDFLYAATENGVYRLEGDTLKPLKFEAQPDIPDFLRRKL